MKISVQQALVYVMVVAAVADREVKDRELALITKSIATLPIFHNYPTTQLDEDMAVCLLLLDYEDGINRILQAIKLALSEKHYATAYALACEVVAADDDISQEELRWLELLANYLHIDLLQIAAIKYSLKARYMHN